MIYEFFGANLTYNATISTNTSIHPKTNIDKMHKAVFTWPPELDPTKICFYEMFIEEDDPDVKPKEVYGLVQI